MAKKGGDGGSDGAPQRPAPRPRDSGSGSAGGSARESRSRESRSMDPKTFITTRNAIYILAAIWVIALLFWYGPSWLPSFGRSASPMAMPACVQAPDGFTQLRFEKTKCWVVTLKAAPTGEIVVPCGARWDVKELTRDTQYWLAAPQDSPGGLYSNAGMETTIRYRRGPNFRFMKGRGMVAFHSDRLDTEPKGSETCKPGAIPGF